jgi:hypothetical protein
MNKEEYVLRQKDGRRWVWAGTFPDAGDAIDWAKKASVKESDCRVYHGGNQAETLMGEARNGIWYPVRQVLSE